MRDIKRCRAAFRRQLESVVGPSVGRDLLWDEFQAALEAAERAGFRRAIEEMRQRVQSCPVLCSPPVDHHPV